LIWYKSTVHSRYSQNAI